MLGDRAAAPEEKAPGEWVTTADRAAEAFLAPRLAALVPGSVVVGEEAASSDPRVLERLAAPGDVWLLDPLDGTSAFAAGRGPFAVMAALLRDGTAVAAWVLDPLADRLVTAELGSGAEVDGVPLRVPTSPAPGVLRAAVLTRFLPPDLVRHVGGVPQTAAALVPGSGSAGHDYPALAHGDLDAVLYWRTLPWDHAPGVLLLQEAGGVARRPDGAAYRAAEHDRVGLLAARSPEAWDRALALLVPPAHR